MSVISHPLDGVLVIDKPAGPTSHDVVVCARRALGVRRIGHTGTLDPQASGVLPLVVGQATRLSRYLMAADKEYVATLRFGLSTDTYDAAGRVVLDTGQVPMRADLEAELGRFTGTFEQTPPPFSAKLVDGKRSYALARQGRPVRPGPVRVTVHDIELVELDGARARLRVRCSSGFYLRSLAHDLGEALGTGCVLEALARTRAAGFTLDDAVPFASTVTASRDEIARFVRPIESLLTDVPAAVLTAHGVGRARHGADLGPRELASPPPAAAPLVRLVTPEGRLLGLAEPSRTSGLLHPAVVFS
jgi:tRNA pseudouridine55 synthase